MSPACYTSSLLPEYVGNPLIEALPSMSRPDAEVLDAMAITPAYDVAECQLPPYVRREMVSRLSSLFIPLPPHYELLDRFSTCLRRSYTWRNPLHPQTQAFLHHAHGAVLTASTLTARSSSGSLLFVKGISGIGKSKGIEACLRALGADVIEHEHYHETPLIETQIVWAKVSCPEDRTLKSLCIAILTALDAALGDAGNFTAEYVSDPRVTTGVLTRAVMQYLVNYHVGILVVDELQNLFASKGLPAIELLNFLLRVREESGICLVLCGTYASLQLLQDKFRLSRRVAADVIEMKRPSNGDDPEWVSFCEILWHYQWTSRPKPYSAVVARTLFDLTQGIRGVAVPLFMRTQEDAIRADRTSIAPEHLRTTWRDRFGLLERAMAALRKNDYKALSQWDDLCDAQVLASMERSSSHVPSQPAVSRETPSAQNQPKKGKSAKKPDPLLSKLKEVGGLGELREAGLFGLPKEVGAA
jgi:hypothetical protein